MSSSADYYHFTRDASEVERLAQQHQYMLSCQGYYLHPDIEIPANGARIAEVATGTAIWLQEVASAYTTAECHGFDISDKLFPAKEDLTENLKLHVADMKKPFEDRWLGYFDVVHIRLVAVAMKKEEWAPVLQNYITLLKPGGWIQWVDDDRAYSVRHSLRPVAPMGAAKESLFAKEGEPRYQPPRFSTMGVFGGIVMDNDKAEQMVYGYMNLKRLMKDPKIGNLEKVGCDVYLIDRQDDGSQLRNGQSALGVAAVWGMLKAHEANGKNLSDITRDELARGYMEDIAKGAHHATRAAVFTGRKKD